MSSQCPREFPSDTDEYRLSGRPDHDRQGAPLTTASVHECSTEQFGQH